jgi:choline dehydrogenase-like flavoprotein
LAHQATGRELYRLPQRSKLFWSHWSNQWLTFCDFSYEANNLAGHQRLTAKLRELLKHINCTDHLIPMNAYIGKRMPLAKVAHQNGTLRFGHDPKTSALDANCKAHEVDNLYAVDGGFFCSSAAVNPALTIMANALRVGDHLLERMK